MSPIRSRQGSRPRWPAIRRPGSGAADVAPHGPFMRRPSPPVEPDHGPASVQPEMAGRREG